MDNANLKPSMEGGLEKPTRHIIDWKNPDFLNEEKYEEELRRVADACHGCRRCVSLCNSFPTLFDLIDESETFEVDGVSQSIAKEAFGRASSKLPIKTKVVGQLIK